MVDVNWGAMIDESADAFEVLPKGDYTVKVTKAEATTSSNDKLMFKLTMEVISGPKTGSTVWNNVVLTPDNKKAVYMFYQNLAALGVSAAYLKQSPRPNPDQVAGKMVGAVVKITVDHSVWQGVTREQVKSMSAAAAGSGVGPSPAGPSPTAPAPAPSPSPVADAPTPTGATGAPAPKF